jgi:hypothetical protein
MFRSGIHASAPLHGFVISGLAGFGGRTAWWTRRHWHGACTCHSLGLLAIPGLAGVLPQGHGEDIVFDAQERSVLSGSFKL